MRVLFAENTSPRNTHSDEDSFPGLHFRPVKGVKRAVFIRHGESSANFSRGFLENHGPEFRSLSHEMPLGDPPLTEVGVRQARALGRRIAKIFQQERAAHLAQKKKQTASGRQGFPAEILENAVVFVSPMRRTIETARNVFEIGANQIYLPDVETPKRTQMIDRLLPAAREYFSKDFALGSHPDAVETKYLHRAEYGGALKREHLEAVVGQLLSDRFSSDPSVCLERARKNAQAARKDIPVASAEEQETEQHLASYLHQLKTLPGSDSVTLWDEEHGLGGPAHLCRRWSAAEDRAEWEAVHDNLEHVNDPARMDKLHCEILRALGLDLGEEEGGDTVSGVDASRVDAHPVDTCFVVCHWGTMVNYCNRFCENLQQNERTAEVEWLQDELGWEKIEKIDIFELQNCALKVVEFRYGDGAGQDEGARHAGTAPSKL
jgi:broad specificity phosphatase PhoE